MPRIYLFDLRSWLLLTCATLGCTSAVLAQTTGRTAPPPAAATAPPHTQPAPASLAPADVFDRADLDRDQQLSRAEAQNLPAVDAQFEQWDRDGNGSISKQEFLLHTQTRAGR